MRKDTKKPGPASEKFSGQEGLNGGMDQGLHGSIVGLPDGVLLKSFSAYPAIGRGNPPATGRSDRWSVFIAGAAEQHTSR
jgi:hypothetical protein